MWVLHKCDNRACRNIKHLYLGTRADNIRDAVVRGRLHGPRRGAPKTPEWRAKLSAAHKGKVLTSEHKEKIRLAGLGRKHSQATKDKMRQSQLNRL